MSGGSLVILWGLAWFFYRNLHEHGTCDAIASTNMYKQVITLPDFDPELYCIIDGGIYILACWAFSTLSCHTTHSKEQMITDRVGTRMATLGAFKMCEG